VIDGYEGPPIHDGRVCSSPAIASSPWDPRSAVTVPPGTTVVDTEGMSVLPGPHDMHFHLMLIGHADYEHWDKTYMPRFRTEIMPIAARQLLMAGVTTARELGAPLEDILDVKRRIEKGEIPGPRLFVSGPFIQKKAYFDYEKTFRWGVDSPDDARAKVQKLVDAGVDVIKLIDQDQLTDDEVAAVVETAHRGGKPVVAHAHREDEIRIGLKHGVDCFEHTGLATEPAIPTTSSPASASATTRSTGARPSRGCSSPTTPRACSPSGWTTRPGARAYPRTSRTTSASPSATSPRSTTSP
jgi:imidazolonepropionase-like amidohydrolase